MFADDLKTKFKILTCASYIGPICECYFVMIIYLLVILRRNNRETRIIIGTVRTPLFTNPNIQYPYPNIAFNRHVAKGNFVNYEY